MKALLHAERFKYDILANLPVEISQQIFSHLEVYMVVRSQRVCRRWFELLSSPNLVQSYLRSFFGKRYPPNTEKGPPLEYGTSRTMEELDAYRTGRAFSKKLFLWGLDQPYLKDQVVYCNGIVAWIDNVRGTLHTLRLDAGEANTYVTTEREKLTHITLSESIVAAMSVAGRCYVFELASGAPHVIRLPSASISGLVSSGETVAIMRRSGHPDFSVYLTTWSVTSQKTHSFRPDIFSQAETTPSASCRILVDPTEKSLVCLEYTRPLQDQSMKWLGLHRRTFFATRFSLDGQMISRSSLSVDYSYEKQEPGLPVPSNKRGTFTIWSAYQICKPDNPGVELAPPSEHSYRWFRVLYHSQNGLLELQILPQLAYTPNPKTNLDEFFYWNDIAYGFRHGADDFSDAILVADFHHGICREAEIWTLSRTDREAYFFADGFGKVQIVGDDTFILMLRPNGFTAWCFDKTVTMADEIILYRDARGKELQRRLEDMRRLKGRGHLHESIECYCDSWIKDPKPVQ